MQRLFLATAANLMALAMLLANPVPAPAPPDFSPLKEASLQKWFGADVLLTGKISQVISGPVGLSEPPLRTYKLVLQPEKVLRGQIKSEKTIAVAYSVRQAEPPSFPGPAVQCILALQSSRNGWSLLNYETATPDGLQQAKLAAALPLGWSIKEGKLLSPWASVGKPGPAAANACSVTGRPILLAGSAVRFDIEPIPPTKQVQFANPDGDGEYRLSVKNVTDQPIEVPALLTDGKNIRWNESVVIRCQGKTYPIPGSTGSVKDLKPVVLKPGETVSGTCHVFALEGPEWPRGGYRIDFQFCLAEQSATHSFYYFSRHHDPIRAAVQKKGKD